MDRYFYFQDNKQHGPVSGTELKQLAATGGLRRDSTVWKEGSTKGSVAGKIPGLVFGTASKAEERRAPATTPPLSEPVIVAQAASGPPPTPQPAPLDPGKSPLPDMVGQKGGTLPVTLPELSVGKWPLLGYRLALVVALISVFLPWARLSTSASFMGQSVSQSLSVTGTNTVSGMLTILVVLAGGLLSFLNPSRILKDKSKLGMAAVGVMIALFAILAIATAASHFGAEMHGELGAGRSYADAYGNRASISAGAGIGAYLALVAGLLASGLGFLTKWDRQIRAVDDGSTTGSVTDKIPGLEFGTQSPPSSRVPSQPAIASQSPASQDVSSNASPTTAAIPTQSPAAEGVGSTSYPTTAPVVTGSNLPSVFSWIWELPLLLVLPGLFYRRRPVDLFILPVFFTLGLALLIGLVPAIVIGKTLGFKSVPLHIIYLPAFIWLVGLLVRAMFFASVIRRKSPAPVDGPYTRALLVDGFSWSALFFLLLPAEVYAGYRLWSDEPVVNVQYAVLAGIIAIGWTYSYLLVVAGINALAATGRLRVAPRVFLVHAISSVVMFLSVAGVADFSLIRSPWFVMADMEGGKLVGIVPGVGEGQQAEMKARMFKIAVRSVAKPTKPTMPVRGAVPVAVAAPVNISDDDDLLTAFRNCAVAEAQLIETADLAGVPDSMLVPRFVSLIKTNNLPPDTYRENIWKLSPETRLAWEAWRQHFLIQKECAKERTDLVSVYGKALGDSQARVRRAAVRALSREGDKAAALAPLLIQSLSDRDDKVRYDSLCALKNLGKLKECAPLLRQLAAEDSDKDVRKLAQKLVNVADPGSLRAELAAIPALNTDAIADWLAKADDERYALEAKHNELAFSKWKKQLISEGDNRMLGKRISCVFEVQRVSGSAVEVAVPDGSAPIGGKVDIAVALGEADDDGLLDRAASPREVFELRIGEDIGHKEAESLIAGEQLAITGRVSQWRLHDGPRLAVVLYPFHVDGVTRGVVQRSPSLGSNDQPAPSKPVHDNAAVDLAKLPALAAGATLDWLAKLARDRQAIAEKRNEILIREWEAKTLPEVIERIEGKRLTAMYRVGRIAEQSVDVQDVVEDESPLRVALGTEGLRRYGERGVLHIGKDISPETARSLAAGDRLSISGRVFKVSVEWEGVVPGKPLLVVVLSPFQIDAVNPKENGPGRSSEKDHAARDTAAAPRLSELFRAMLLRDDSEAFSAVRWVPALKRPALAIRFGFATKAVTSAGRSLNETSLQKNENASARVAIAYWGHVVGQPLLRAVAERATDGQFGQCFREDKGSRRDLEAVSDGGNSNGKSPVMVLGLLNSGQFADIAGEKGLDVLIVGTTVLKPPTPHRTGLAPPVTALTVSILDALRNQTLWTSQEIEANSAEVGTGYIDAQVIDKLTADVASFLEKQVGLTDMPTLTSDAVKRRAEAALLEPHANPLRLLVELRYYYSRQLLTLDELFGYYAKLIGPDDSRKLAVGTEEERLKIIQKWLAD